MISTRQRTRSQSRRQLPQPVIEALGRDEVPMPIKEVAQRKQPAIKWKHLQGLPRPSRADVEKFPESDRWGNVTGIISGVVLLDYDGEQGRELLEEHGFLPHRETARGFHVRVAHPGRYVKTKRAVLSGLDVRGEGGYELFYAPDREDLRDPGDLVPWDEIPRELRRKLLNLGKHLPTDLLLDLAIRQSDGQRNETGFYLAMWMRENRYSKDEALEIGAQYVDAVSTNGDHPYTLDEFEASVEQAFSGKGPDGRYEVTFNDKNGKPELPELPDRDDLAGHLEWLTTVFNLDPNHPITKAEWHGLHGPDGAIEIHRLDATPISFSPARDLSVAQKLIQVLGWENVPSDGRPHSFTNAQCADIVYVVRGLCDNSKSIKDSDLAAGIIGSFTMKAKQIEGFTTHGSQSERYEAASELRHKPHMNPHYLVDSATGELVIQASPLQKVARDHLGSSLRRGQLDELMDKYGWERIRLIADKESGKEKRGYERINIIAYRGFH